MLFRKPWQEESELIIGLAIDGLRFLTILKNCVRAAINRFIARLACSISGFGKRNAPIVTAMPARSGGNLTLATYSSGSLRNTRSQNHRLLDLTSRESRKALDVWSRLCIRGLFLATGLLSLGWGAGRHSQLAPRPGAKDRNRRGKAVGVGEPNRPFASLRVTCFGQGDTRA